MPAGAFDKGEMLGTSVKAPFCGALAHIGIKENISGRFMLSARYSCGNFPQRPKNRPS